MRVGKHRLPKGTAWPMPLLLQFSETQIKDLAVGERITLCNDTGEIHAVLDVSEIYQLNLENHAADLALRHPNILAWHTSANARGVVCSGRYYVDY
jgi:ATP sulfurylase